MGEPRERVNDHAVGVIHLSSRRHTYTDALSDPRDYLKHVMKATNMSCLTPEGAISGECDFLSANMYARSLFGKCSLSWVGKALC